MGFLRRLLGLACPHDWEASCYSGKGAFTTEETCRLCGARHHQTDSYAYCRGEWIPGPHPWAEAERAKEAGKVPQS